MMEDAQVKGETIDTVAVHSTEQVKKPSKVLGIVNLTGLILLTGVVVFVSGGLIFENKELKNQVSTLSKTVKDQESQISKIEPIKNISFALMMQHEMESGVVTDDFYVSKVNFVSIDNTLKLVIDVNTQPDLTFKYKGKGVFDLQDRELRTKSTDIINKVKEYYNAHKIDTMANWDDKSEIRLTIKNYDIGKMVNGQFVLVGEK